MRNPQNVVPLLRSTLNTYKVITNYVGTRKKFNFYISK